MRGRSDFRFESVEIIDYKLHKINLKREKIMYRISLMVKK